MLSIEDIASAFEGLPLAVANRWNLYPLRAGRVYLSRDQAGRYSLFIVGSKDSFGILPSISGISYSENVQAVPENLTLEAVRLTSSSLSFGNRVMAHVAYELEKRLEVDAAVTNATLLSEVRWILELLNDQDEILSAELQKGLFGELVLIRKLLLVAKQLGVPAASALKCWHGYDRAKRDFSGPMVAVEVKTTSLDARHHRIGSLAQLEPQGEEEVFLFSVGVKMDPSAPRKLPDFVRDVLALLTTPDGRADQDLQSEFFAGLLSYGYNHQREQLYKASSGFLNVHLQPKFFRECDLERVRLVSFKNDALPSMVLDVGYLLNVNAEELSPSDEKAVLRRCLGFA